MAFRIVLCTTKTTRIQEWVSDTHAYNYVLACIAIGSRRNMLLVVTLAKTRCKFCTRKLSPKIEDKKLHFDKEKTLVPYQFPPFFRGPLETGPSSFPTLYAQKIWSDGHHFDVMVLVRIGRLLERSEKEVSRNSK